MYVHICKVCGEIWCGHVTGVYVVSRCTAVIAACVWRLQDRATDSRVPSVRVRRPGAMRVPSPRLFAAALATVEEHLSRTLPTQRVSHWVAYNKPAELESLLLYTAPISGYRGRHLASHLELRLPGGRRAGAHVSSLSTRTRASLMQLPQWSG